MSKHSDNNAVRRYFMAQELHRRAGGDINQIIPAMNDMIKAVTDMGIKDYPHEQVRAETAIIHHCLLALAKTKNALDTSSSILKQAQKDLEELRNNDNNKTTKEH